MDFAFSAEQDELRRYTSQWLAERAPSSEIRRIADSEHGLDPTLWKQMAEMGWLGMAIAEDHGGAGFGFVEQVVLLEELGASLFPSPYFSTTVLGANALAWAGSDDQRGQWLPRVATGDAIVTVAFDGVTAAPGDGGIVLSGRAPYVLDGGIADLVVVAATEADGLSLFAVPGEVVSSRDLDTMDRTRRAAALEFDAVRCPPEWRMTEPGSAAPVIDSLSRRAAVAIAVEQTGGARACLEMSVDYAGTRRQFGRPIGSFQAVKHMCADMFVAVQAAQAAAYYAAWAESTGSQDADAAASLAKAHCSEAFFRCAADTIQVHGGIGFTWEHDAHLYFKRAETSRLLFGSPTAHRRRLAAQLGMA